jgi:hypothetical protein
MIYSRVLCYKRKKNECRDMKCRFIHSTIIFPDFPFSDRIFNFPEQCVRDRIPHSRTDISSRTNELDRMNQKESFSVTSWICQLFRYDVVCTQDERKIRTNELDRRNQKEAFSVTSWICQLFPVRRCTVCTQDERKMMSALLSILLLQRTSFTCRSSVLLEHDTSILLSFRIYPP